MNGSTADPTNPAGSSSSTATNGDDATTSTAPSDGSTSTTLDSDATTDGDDATPGDSTPSAGDEGSGNRGITDPAEIAALEGNIDLGDDGRSNGSPVPLVAAGLVATGLVVGGVRQRRRRQAVSHPT